MKTVDIAKPFAVGERKIDKLVFDEPTMYQLELFYEALDDVEDVGKLSELDANQMLIAVLNEITATDATGKERLDVGILKRHLKRSEYKACLPLLVEFWPEEDEETDEPSDNEEAGTPTEGKAESAD
jgi:hypothetical protein